MPIERDKRRFLSVGNVLTILGMLGAIVAVWVATAAENADTKRRVTVVEARQQEDRVSAKTDREVIKANVKETNDNVQKILLKLESWEATQRERDRRVEARP